MNVEYWQIESVEDPENPKPWYVVELNGNELEIVDDKDGGRESALSKNRTKIPDHVDLPDESQVSKSGKISYAITEEGEFISYDPEDEDVDVAPLRAHVGFYDPDKHTLTLMRYVETN